MNFNDILKTKFDRKKKRIETLHKENKENGELLEFSIQFLLLISLVTSVFYPIFALDYGFFNFLIGFTMFFSLCFIIFGLFNNKMNKIQKLNKKFKNEKYKSFLDYSQYSFIIRKIKNCDFEEFKQNKQIIFDYIKTLSLPDQESMIKLINEKIDLHENGLKKIEERIDNLSSNTIKKEKAILKSI